MTPPRPPSQPLSITEDAADGAVRLTLAGHVDFTSAPDLAARIERARRDGHERLELDLAEVGFVDATGLAVLMSARRKFAAENERIVLRRISAQLRKVLEVTGLARYFEFA